MIDPRKREGVFRTSVVEVGVINTNSPVPILFRDYHHVHQPFWILDFSYETDSEKFVDLFFDHFSALWVEASQLLPYWFMASSNIKVMLGHVTTNTNLNMVRPDEDVRVFLQEGQKFFNFLLGKGGSEVYLLRSMKPK